MKYEFQTPNIPLFNMAKAQKMFATDITRTLDEMMRGTVQNLMTTVPRATGELAASIDSERVGKTSGRVFVAKNYGVIIEKGRRPGPVGKKYHKSLIKWFKVSNKGRSYFARLKSVYGKGDKFTYTQAAYALASKLKKYGFKKNPFFSKGIQKSKKMYKDESRYLLGKIARGLVKK